jgi:uncharacterized membrane protein
MGTLAPLPGGRRQYLDWLRGVAVLTMILGHGVDAWTLDSDRGGAAYRQSLFVGGIGAAPVFLFLAGVALALAAGARVRSGRTDHEVAALARTRGGQVFGLALLFRLQSWVLGGGDPQRMLKVDILNVMGLSMVLAALLWFLCRSQMTRALVLSVAAVCTAMVTPIVRAAGSLAFLPDPVEAYLRPAAGATFSLFPWAGFVLAGCAAGLWLEAAQTPREERRAIGALAILGATVAVAGYGASFLPPIYEQSSFWSSSPTFFFVRLGIVLCLLSLAYVWCARASGRSRLAHLGRSSLLVYWVHVELAYGVVSTPLHRGLSLEMALLGVLLLSLLMYALVQAKARFDEHRRNRHPEGHPAIRGARMA